MIDRVLRRNDEKRWGEPVGLAIHGDTGFRHRFQESGLRARCCAIDFVGEENIGKDGSGAKLELSGLLIEDRGAGDIPRKKIGRALNPLETPSDAGGQRASQHRLRNTWNVFEQNVATRKPGDER